MTSGETVGVPVGVGVKVAVGFNVEVGEGIGVMVETVITLFPIVQLTRSEKDHMRNKNLFATMITSVIPSLLSWYTNIHAPN